MAIVVPEECVWYVKGALQRSLFSMEKTVIELNQSLEQNPVELPPVIVSQIRGAIKYHQQWIREAKEAFAKLPKEIRPQYLLTPTGASDVD